MEEQKRIITIIMIEDTLDDASHQKSLFVKKELWERVCDTAVWLHPFKVVVELAVEIDETWDGEHNPFPKEQALRRILDSGCHVVLLDLSLCTSEETLIQGELLAMADHEAIENYWNSPRIKKISGLWILQQLHALWLRGEPVPLVAVSTNFGNMVGQDRPWRNFLFAHGALWLYEKSMSEAAANAILRKVVFGVAGNGNWGGDHQSVTMMRRLSAQRYQEKLWDVAQEALFCLLEHAANEEDPPLVTRVKQLGMSVNTYKSWRAKLETAHEEGGSLVEPVSKSVRWGQHEVLVLQLEDSQEDAVFHNRLIGDRDLWGMSCGGVPWIKGCQFRFKSVVDLVAWDREKGPFPRERVLMHILSSGCRAILLDLALTLEEESFFEDILGKTSTKGDIERFWNSPGIEKVSGLWILQQIHALWKRGLPVPLVAVAKTVHQHPNFANAMSASWDEFLFKNGAFILLRKPLAYKVAKWFHEAMAVVAASSPVPFFPEFTWVLWQAAREESGKPALWDNAQAAMFRFLDQTHNAEDSLANRAQRLGMAVNTYKRWRELSGISPEGDEQNA